MKKDLDKNKPVPGRPVPQHLVKYPFADMKVNESFAKPKEDRKKVAAAASMYGLRHGMRFVTRLVVENGKTVVRCWRVE